eukprot:SAG31_NODE_1661_length_7596_cov_4.503802_7_plen_66_part_00
MIAKLIFNILIRQSLVAYAFREFTHPQCAGCVSERRLLCLSKSLNPMPARAVKRGQDHGPCPTRT